MSAAGAGTQVEELPARLATLHLIVGWVTVVAFLATGLFMRLGYPGVAPPDLAHRVFFRTHHLYLLGAALVQLVVGMQARTARQSAPRPRLALAASILILAAPPLLFAGFATEHATQALRGEATSLGWFALSVGVLFQLLAWRR